MISENKLKHTIAVARKCEQLAKENDLSIEQQNACFVMGFLHDIGYEITPKDNISIHGEHSYNMVADFIDACKTDKNPLDAIRTHGQAYEDLSVFDVILNTADLTIDHEGREVSVEQRLKSIKERYGHDSDHYYHALKQAKALN